MTGPDPAGARTTSSSRLALRGVVAFSVLAVMWFLFSWFFLEASLIDALGETFGGVAVTAVIVSIVGSLGQSR